jgi:hypothetical protein
MRKFIHQSYRSIMARCGKSPRLISSHGKLQFVSVLRRAKNPISFHSLFQKKIGLSSEQLLITQPQVELYKVRDCWLAGRSGYIYPDQDCVLGLDTATRPRPMEKADRPIPKLATKIDTPLFHLAGNGDSRAHLVIEHLSRYQIAADRLPADSRILAHEGQGNWQMEYLNLADVTRPPLETTTGSLFCRELYYVPLPSGLIGEPDHYLALRRRALQNSTPDQRPVFITRRDAPDRKLANEDSIFEIARQMIPNVERISLAGLTLREQLERTAGAPIFISPHGQGTHLTLFCQNTVSVQLVPGMPDLNNEFYRCALLFDYFASLGHQNKTVTVASGHRLKDLKSDWFYPEQKFKSELAAAVSNL